MLANPCELMNSAISTLFRCEQVNGYMRIRTPYLYPDGDVIDLFVRDDGKFQTITDLGETVRWLKMQAVSSRRTERQTRLIQDISRTLGVEFFQGALSLRVSNAAQIADEVTRLAQACIRVSDLWFTFRTRTFESITEEIATFLADHQVPFEPNAKFVGRSQNVWPIDFHTRTPPRSSLVQVLSTGNKSAASQIVARTLAGWYDLNYLQLESPSLHFVSLFDDTMNIWKEQDFALLASISDVRFWSRPDEVLASLGA